MTRRGLGLVEILLAAVIMAASVGVLFQALGLSVKGTEQVAEEIVATQIAAELVDLFGGLAFAELPAVPEGAPAAAAEKLAGPLAERVRKRLDVLAVPAGFQALVALEPLASETSVGRCKRILVTVRWGHQPRARAVKLARLVSDEVGLEP